MSQAHRFGAQPLYHLGLYRTRGLVTVGVGGVHPPGAGHTWSKIHVLGSFLAPTSHYMQFS